MRMRDRARAYVHVYMCVYGGADRDGGSVGGEGDARRRPAQVHLPHLPAHPPSHAPARTAALSRTCPHSRPLTHLPAHPPSIQPALRAHGSCNPPPPTTHPPIQHKQTP